MWCATRAEFRPQLLAFDLDGTVLEDGGMQVPSSTRAAMTRLKRQGLRIAVITGRDHIPPEVMAALQPDMCALHTGAVILRGQAVVRQASLTAHEIRTVSAMRPPDGHVLALTRERVHAQLAPLPDLASWQQRWALAHRPFVPFYPLVPEQVMGLWCFHGAIGRWKAEVQQRLPHLVVSGAQPPYVDNMNVSPAGVDKGEALRRIAAELGIALVDIWAFGDSDNDLPMLRIAGRAVQVGNLPLLSGHVHEVIGHFETLGLWLDRQLGER